ncbi:hypothetical protein C7C46_32510 [Streptomyces tateyamensis]|uniref:LysM domain-containing protein n=1 Tax=Streptomyces tateyamensis TaxID=565073 RepID=A0A2V4NX52_9ACTN|nr:LysM peptidoglycan-binding domain-containing protein [Streptomyces tateyamensis]PYC65577.1 hypothetical protein C7C46_32510 [Streptomyces tateyamensis]
MTSTIERLGRLLRALGAAAALAGLLAGLPYALLVWAEEFRPKRLPELDEVMAWANSPLSTVLLLQLLYCLSWVLWTYLLLQTLREVIWYAANFGALLRAAGSETFAFTARQTVAGLLVGAIVLALAASLRSAPAARSTTALAAWSTPVAATAPATPTMTTLKSAPAPAADRAAAQAASACTVRPGDTLWDLADRHLDNPLRWREIYELNKLRPQFDGRHLDDPDEITPGWTFLLPRTPEPATAPPAPPAPDRLSVPADHHDSAAPTSPAPTPSATTGTQPAPAPQTAQSNNQPPPHVAATHHEAPEPGIELPRGAGYLAVTVGAALSAAAVRRTLRRRRDYRPGDQFHEHEDRPEETPLVAAMRGITRHHQDAYPQAGGRESAAVELPLATGGGRQHGLLDLLANQQVPAAALTGPAADDAARALLATVLTTPGRASLLMTRAEAERLAPGLMESQVAQCRLVADTEHAFGALEE